VGYVVLEEDAVFTESDVKQYLDEKIPVYMIPAFYRVIERIPLSPNGKVDHKLLPDPDNERIDEPDDEGVPENELEQKISHILLEVAELNHLGVKTSFFDAGINSLHLVRFRTRIKETLGRDIEMMDFFKYANIRSLSLYLSGNHRKKLDLDQAGKIADVRSAKRNQRRKAARTRSA
jgi:acyl carrier protein